MAKNTCLKELQNDMKKMLVVVEQVCVDGEKREENTAKQLAGLELAIADLYKKQNHGSLSSGKEAIYNQPFQARRVKLDFPHFNGSEVLQSIFKAEQFLDYYHTPEDQRLTIVAIHIFVVPWLQMMLKTNPFQYWMMFTCGNRVWSLIIRVSTF